MPTLTCPHCGFSKELAKVSSPPTGTKVTCPKCRSYFFYQEPFTETPSVQITNDNIRKGHHAKIELIAKIFIFLCYMPYMIIIIGFISVINAVGEDKLGFLRFMPSGIGIFIFNLIAGIPMMLIKYDRNQLRYKVVITYLFCVVLPLVLFFALSLLRHK